MGSKPSGLFLLPAVVLANLVGKTPHVRRRLTISFIVAACIALIGQPTLLVRGLRAYLFVGGLLHHLDVAAGVSLPPYTLQFANTPRWTYYLSHLLRWGAGPLLLTIGSAGGILAAIRLVSSRREWRTDSHLGQLAVTWLVFAAFYLLSAGQRDQFSRYVLPLLPPLAILSGWFVTEHIQRLSSTWRRLVVVMIVITALVPGLMYARIYRRPDTRLQAAVWVERNIPPGSAICHEPDLGFAVPPIGMGGPAFGTTRSQNYQGTMLDWGLLYWASDYVRQNQSVPVTEKLEMQSVRTQAQQRLRIQSWLATCDWLILSDRFADQYLPLPNDFEAISTFYADLLSNRHVDFQKIAEFRSLPGMFNLTIDDRESELTFRSFDHPTIWVFHRRQS